MNKKTTGSALAGLFAFFVLGIGCSQDSESTTKPIIPTWDDGPVQADSST